MNGILTSFEAPCECAFNNCEMTFSTVADLYLRSDPNRRKREIEIDSALSGTWLSLNARKLCNNALYSSFNFCLYLWFLALFIMNFFSRGTCGLMTSEELPSSYR